MISDTGDDKKTQKSRSVPLLSSPSAIRDHVPSDVLVSNYPCDFKHSYETRVIGAKFHRLNYQLQPLPVQDDAISGTDTSSSEVYGKSPCFVLPKKRRKSNKDNYWPTYDHEQSISEEECLKSVDHAKKPSMDLSCKSSIRVRSGGFFVPDWSAAGEEYVDEEVETSSDFRDDNDYSQDDDATTKNDLDEDDDALNSIDLNSDSKLNVLESQGVSEMTEFMQEAEVKEEEEEEEEEDAMVTPECCETATTVGGDTAVTPTYDQSFQQFMTACEEDLLENEAFPKMWGSDVSCAEDFVDHGGLSSSHKTSGSLEGSKASLTLEMGMTLSDDDMESQLANAADVVVQTIIKEETQAVMDCTKANGNTKSGSFEDRSNDSCEMGTVICSHVMVESNLDNQSVNTRTEFADSEKSSTIVYGSENRTACVRTDDEATLPLRSRESCGTVEVHNDRAVDMQDLQHLPTDGQKNRKRNAITTSKECIMCDKGLQSEDASIAGETAHNSESRMFLSDAMDDVGGHVRGTGGIGGFDIVEGDRQLGTTNDNKGVLTVSLEKLHLEKKRNGCRNQPTNAYAERPEAFESYMDSDEGYSCHNNSSVYDEPEVLPQRDDGGVYFMTERNGLSPQTQPKLAGKTKGHSISDEKFNSSEWVKCEEGFVLKSRLASPDNPNSGQRTDSTSLLQNENSTPFENFSGFSTDSGNEQVDEQTPPAKPLYIFATSMGMANHLNKMQGDKAPMLMCDDVRLLKQRRQIRPHSASTNRESLQESTGWVQQIGFGNEYVKQRAKTTHKCFIIDKPCSEVRSDECLSSVSVISPSGISENVDVDSPSWSNESVNKYREFAKMRKRELLARFVAERKHREELDQLLAQLHDSYDKLLAKHAEAENTIDQLRLGKPMKVDRLSPSMHFSQPVHLESQMISQDYSKNSSSLFHSSPRVGQSMTSMKENQKRTSLLLDANIPMHFEGYGFSSSRRVADNFCQTDFCPESINEPFCSSVASFLLRANCLLEQVNSLHECVVEGINIEPNVALQMLSYLWESYLALQHDVQAHVGHAAALEKIALEDVRNLLAKIHSQLIAIETHHANIAWKSLLPSAEKRFDPKTTFSFLRESSSYGSLPASPSGSTNSQRSESRENFSADGDSGCLSAEKQAVPPPKTNNSPGMNAETNTQTPHEGSDYFNTTLDKVESKSSNESECIEVVKTLLRAIHSEEIQSSLRKRSSQGAMSSKGTMASSSDTTSKHHAKHSRSVKSGHVESNPKSLEIDAVFSLGEKMAYEGRGAEGFDARKKSSEMLDGETVIDISCMTDYQCSKTSQTNVTSGEFSMSEVEPSDYMETGQSTAETASVHLENDGEMLDRTDDYLRMGRGHSEHQETLTLLASLDQDQRRILEETLRLLSSSSQNLSEDNIESQSSLYKCNSLESNADGKMEEEQTDSERRREIPTDLLSMEPECPPRNQSVPKLNELFRENLTLDQAKSADELNAVKKDVVIRLLEEVKKRLYHNCGCNDATEATDVADGMEGSGEQMNDGVRSGILLTDMSNVERVCSNEWEFESREADFQLEDGLPSSKDDVYTWTSPCGGKNSGEEQPTMKENGNNELTESSEISTESFSEVNSEVAIYYQPILPKTTTKDLLHSRKQSSGEKCTTMMLEKLNEQIQQLRYEILEKGIHSEEGLANAVCNQSSQTENDSTPMTNEEPDHVLPVLPLEQPTSKINHGDTILHCCSVHHIVRQKSCSDEVDDKDVVNLTQESSEKVLHCPYCHQAITSLDEYKAMPPYSSLSSEILAESEDRGTQMSCPATAINDECEGDSNVDEFVKKCDSFTESEETNVETTTLINTVCSCMEGSSGDRDMDYNCKEMAQVREVFFAVVECDGLGTKECYASVETSNTILGATTIDSGPSQEDVVCRSNSDYPTSFESRMEKPVSELWENAWYEYSGTNRVDSTMDSFPKSFIELGKLGGLRSKSGSPPMSEERSWTSHHWFKSYNGGQNQLTDLTRNRFAVEESEKFEFEREKGTSAGLLLIKELAPTEGLEFENTSDGGAFLKLQDTKSNNESNSPVQSSNVNADDMDSVMLSPRSEDLSADVTPDATPDPTPDICGGSDHSNLQSPETTDTSLPTSSSLARGRKRRTGQELTPSSSCQNCSTPIHPTPPSIMGHSSPGDGIDDDENMTESIVDEQLRICEVDDEITLNEDLVEPVVTEDADEGEVPPPSPEDDDDVFVEDAAVEEMQSVGFCAETQNEPPTSIGVQVAVSQRDVHVQALPSLCDVNTQMTVSSDTSQETDADAVSFNSRDHSEKDEDEEDDRGKMNPLVVKTSAHSDVPRGRNTFVDDGSTDSHGQKIQPTLQVMSDSELRKSKRHHSRKLSRRSISHSVSSQSSQNEDHQSCKSCARLLRKTEALATTMLQELKGQPLNYESSDENMQMKKIQLVHALDLANKIAKRLKHHSVRMLHSLSAGSNYKEESTL